jgi:thymidylate synthase
MRTLYKPEKYETIIGDGNGIALATCWTNPFALVTQYPELKDNFSIIGSLYGKEGVSVILRNLCLNPDVRHLYVLYDAKLSKTAFGSMGWKMVEVLWKNGVDSDNKIKNDGSQLHKEIDVNVIEKVLSNVKVSFVSVDELAEIKSSSEKTYMESISFPEPKRDMHDPFPSEDVGFSIHGKKIVDAWLGVVNRIVCYGQMKGTDYGNQQKECHLVTWTIDDEDIDNPYIPDWPEDICQLVGLKKESIKEYMASLLDSNVPDGTTYTYGQRLRSYRGEIDQIDAIIKTLKTNGFSRRCFATTLYPPEDLNHKYPPCLVLVQFLTNGHKVNMIATFRSHDIFKAAIPNAFALLGLQKYVVDKTGLERGKLAICSNSAHIYEEEWTPAMKLVVDQWNSVNTKFDENADVDPRGVVRIEIIGKEIKATLVSPEGRECFDFTGKTAREVIMQFAKLNLLSKASHYADISIELVKAEISLKTGAKYVQDNPITVDGVTIR